RWAIFNEDGASMPPGTLFNIEYATNAAASAVVTTTEANQLNNAVTFTPARQNASATRFWATPNWNPGSSFGVLNNHLIGVMYIFPNTREGVILNQDVASMPLGASFNVVFAWA
ncbi:MAG TPA: hypothetical protein VF458_05885, partial [Ktedonobacteraceae bacterium]